ncbi:ribonuclease M5 [Agrilactobacillus fermenti]|uniref:ribonuclease M5 n=1 Tax=Agrilactobacillus fermenti TaxID=2586909 RepID=UPI002E7C3314|nr:ribonuclease M5 [Agrilactobacillus fermenti]MCD2255986.1 ribonuclease M5 [Agrilactobacillus fermenti]
MTKIQEIIIVEGRDDTKRLQQFDPTIDTIETNGSAIDDATLKLIAEAQKRRGIIVFTDPDAPGEKIRKTILQRIPDAKQAFLPASSAVPKSKGTLGVEHASNAALKQALMNAYQTQTDAKYVATITQADLIEAGLLAGPQAKKRRLLLGDVLNIGLVNGKQLLKRLTAFQISRNQFLTAVAQVNQLQDDRLLKQKEQSHES